MSDISDCEPVQNAVHLLYRHAKNDGPREGVFGKRFLLSELRRHAVAVLSYMLHEQSSRCFIPPVHAADRPGRWRRYYKSGNACTPCREKPTQLELIPPLARLTPALRAF